MTRSTDELRALWGPACTGKRARVTLHGGAVVSVRPAILDAVAALNACMAAHDYEATPPDCGAQNCRPITGGTKYSLHAYGIAIDINWQNNPYGRLRTDMPPAMVDAIKRIRTRSGAQVWRWGGDYSGNRDAMHYEVVASPAEILTGIDPATVPGGKTKPPTKPDPKPDLEEYDDMALIVQVKESGTLWVVDGVARRPVTMEDARLLALARYARFNDKGQPYVHPRATVELVPVVKP